MTHLDTTRQFERAGTVGRGVAGQDICHVDAAIGGEVPAGHQVGDVAPRLVRTGHPRATLAHPRVHQVADPGFGVLTQDLRADVTLDQCRVIVEVFLGEWSDLRWRDGRL